MNTLQFPTDDSKAVLGALASWVFRAVQGLVALAGFALLFIAIVLAVRPELRQAGERELYSLLQDRRMADVGLGDWELDIRPGAHERATAIDLLNLTEEQASIAYWLSHKYRVAPEPLGALVAEAYALGDKHRLDPKLILSVMAIESRFNPFAQSSVGAQGLMQVMTTVHQDKYALFGGNHAAFDPVTNLQVGSVILQDCINRFGSVQNGLRCYVGAAKLPSDGGYAAKVLAEHARLQKVARDGLRAVQPKYRAALQAKMQKTGPDAGRIAAGSATATMAADAAGRLRATGDAVLLAGMTVPNSAMVSMAPGLRNTGGTEQVPPPWGFGAYP